MFLITLIPYWFKINLDKNNIKIAMTSWRSKVHNLFEAKSHYYYLSLPPRHMFDIELVYTRNHFETIFLIKGTVCLTYLMLLCVQEVVTHFM